MNDTGLARRHIADEARSLLTRLARVRPFALQETMLPAAALAPQALVAIERFLVGGRFALREQVREFLRWLDGPGRTAPPDELQRRYTIVRLAFNDALSQFDTFSEVVTQRSEAESGVWLSGLDVLAADALALPGYFQPPPVVCYLARGPGAAIRRARTRVPGGGSSPVAIVRVPRERMVGYGIGSSLVHEVGHQAAALLGLVATAKASVDARAQQAPPVERRAWELWSRWISEIVADLWSVGKLGIGSTLGLAGVVSLPQFFVFRIATDDPHPAPWIRVVLSCAVGDALYPHPQWRRLAAMWEQLYPPTRLSPLQRTQLDALRATTPQLARLLVEHRPPSLRGRSIRELMPVEERRPERLSSLYTSWKGAHERMRDAAPSLAMAVIGQARADGAIGVEAESRTVGNLLTYWALRSTLDLSEQCAAPEAHRPLAARRDVAREPLLIQGGN